MAAAGPSQSASPDETVVVAVGAAAVRAIVDTVGTVDKVQCVLGCLVLN